MKKVLVVYASKHGSTKEIGEYLCQELQKTGITAVSFAVANAPSPTAYDIVVLGSAVYAGSWRKEAIKFADNHTSILKQKTVWLFSSGPIGDPPKPAAENSVHLDSILDGLNSREHIIFSGKIDRSRLSFGEKAIASALHVPEGDFRNWEAIADWAKKIAKA
jgi:menaquinone-dependent protoporphyrinogen oxidase